MVSRDGTDSSGVCSAPSWASAKDCPSTICTSMPSTGSVTDSTGPASSAFAYSSASDCTAAVPANTWLAAGGSSSVLSTTITLAPM
jgi:hypothetical protein